MSDVYDLAKQNWCYLCDAPHEPCDQPWLDELDLSDAAIDKLHANDCRECYGTGYYWAEGNPDSVLDDPNVVILECSEPFDGTICVRCHVCNGTGHRVS